jgi:hypothetical protein
MTMAMNCGPGLSVMKLLLSSREPSTHHHCSLVVQHQHNFPPLCHVGRTQWRCLRAGAQPAEQHNTQTSTLFNFEGLFCLARVNEVVLKPFAEILKDNYVLEEIQLDKYPRGLFDLSPKVVFSGTLPCRSKRVARKHDQQQRPSRGTGPVDRQSYSTSIQSGHCILLFVAKSFVPSGRRCSLN